MAKNYWKPTTPEQIADFKARRKIINKASKERIKLRDMGLLDAPLKIGRPPKMTDEQRKARHTELQRIRRGRIEVEQGRAKVVASKVVKVAPKTYSRANPRPAPKRLPDLLPDPNKVKVKLKDGLWIFTEKGANLDEKRAKYGIAI